MPLVLTHPCPSPALLADTAKLPSNLSATAASTLVSSAVPGTLAHTVAAVAATLCGSPLHLQPYMLDHLLLQLCCCGPTALAPVASVLAPVVLSALATAASARCASSHADAVATAACQCLALLAPYVAHPHRAEETVLALEPLPPACKALVPRLLGTLTARQMEIEWSSLRSAWCSSVARACARQPVVTHVV